MSTLVSQLDSATLRSAFGTFPTGVVAVAARVDGVRTGFAASSFVSVSIDPPLVSICVQNTSTTWSTLQDCPTLGISVLGEAHEEVARALAGRAADRFTDLDTTTTAEGSVFVDDACAWLDTTVHSSIPAGDHMIVVLRVTGLAVHHRRPVVFHGSGFRDLR